MPDFQPGDRVKVEGHEGFAEVIKIEPIGKQYNVKLFFESGPVNKIFPLTNIYKVPSILEKVKSKEFDPTWKYNLYMDTLRFNLAYKYDPLFSLSITRIDVLPHQVDAVYKVVNSMKPRFLLADDTGLGKTVMIGMILKELKFRKRAQRALFIVPAPLQYQWIREMRTKFDEVFHLYNSDRLQTMRYEVGPSENLWNIHNKIVTSIDYVKNTEIREQLKEAEPWDIIIFDEAHKLSKYRYGNEIKKTMRYRVGEALEKNSEGFILLTATPHKGDTYAFFGLLNLIDSYLFPDIEYMSRDKINDIMIRRMKEEVYDFEGKSLFPPREVHTLPLSYPTSGREQELYVKVTEYVQNGYNLAKRGGDRAKIALGFAMVILQKRMVSSIYAIKKSLINRKSRLEALLEYNQTFELSDRDYKLIKDYNEDPEMFEDSKKEEIEKKIEALPVAKRPEDVKEEIKWLNELIKLADSIEVDSKAQRLIEFIDQTLEDKNEKVLIFTEYKDTLDYLSEIFIDKGYNLAIIHGGMDMSSREQAEKRFRESDCPLMIATDAAGEGINLQFCHIMVNYELPWNPNKIEQRMGRLHRYGQQNKVHIFNLLVNNTREGNIFDGILKKIDTIKKEMGERTFDVMGELLSDVDITELVMGTTTKKDSERQILEPIYDRIDRKKEEIFNQIRNESLIEDHLNLDPLKELMNKSRTESVDEGDLLRFNRVFINNVGGRISRVSKNIFRIRPSMDLRSYNDVGRLYPKATFSRKRASNDRNLEFISLGHALFNAMMNYVEREDWGGRIALKIAPTNESGYIFTFITKIRDGTGKIIDEYLFNYIVSENGTIKKVTPKAIWDFEDMNVRIDNEKLDYLTKNVDYFINDAKEKILNEIGGFIEEIKEEREKKSEIKEQDANNYYRTKIDKSNERIKKYNKDLEKGRNMKIAIERENYEVEKSKSKLSVILNELKKEKNVSPDFPEIKSICLLIPTNAIQEVESSQNELKEKVESIAMKTAMTYERKKGREPIDISMKFKGYDIESYGTNYIRYIEVKGLKGEGTVELTENEWFKAKKLEDDYWLYIVSNSLESEKRTLNMIQNPTSVFPEDEILKKLSFKVKIPNWKEISRNARF